MTPKRKRRREAVIDKRVKARPAAAAPAAETAAESPAQPPRKLRKRLKAARGRGRPRRNLNPKYQPLRIREWREKLGLTQAQLGQRMNRPAALISRLEGGVTPYDQTHVEALAMALGIEISMLFTGPASTEDQQIREVLAKVGNDPDRKRQMLGVIKALVAA